MGFKWKEIAAMLQITEKMCHQSWRKEDVKKVAAPCLEKVFLRSGRMILGKGASEEYLRGTADRVVARMLAIESFSPADVYGRDGLPMLPNELPESVRMCIKDIKGPKMLKVGGEMRPMYEYSVLPWDRAAEELLGTLGIDISKRKIQQEKVKAEGGGDQPIARVDFGRDGEEE